MPYIITCVVAGVRGSQLDLRSSGTSLTPSVLTSPAGTRNLSPTSTPPHTPEERSPAGQSEDKSCVCWPHLLAHATSHPPPPRPKHQRSAAQQVSQRIDHSVVTSPGGTRNLSPTSTPPHTPVERSPAGQSEDRSCLCWPHLQEHATSHPPPPRPIHQRSAAQQVIQRIDHVCAGLTCWHTQPLTQLPRLLSPSPTNQKSATQ
jgi:hypothetical protein